MSETERYKGKLKPTGKTLGEYSPESSDIYDLNETAVEIDGKIFIVERECVDTENDIYEATKNSDGTIDFEVKYYNGGCGFEEAIGDAIKSCDQK